MKRNVKSLNRFKIAVALTAVLVMVSCAGKNNVKMDGSFNLKHDEFFQNTRLIMSKGEIKVYKHLPDNDARKAFIEEFWAKRDPSPGSGDNEAKIEFEKRLEVIERWFKERTGKHRGVDSDRGKIFLFLGAPDERTRDHQTINHMGSTVTVPVERWVYHRHQLFLQFIDYKGFGEFRLTLWTPQLLTAIDQEKFAVYSGEKTGMKFKFKAKYQKDSFHIQLPVKGITFDEKDGKMNVTFKITVYVYQDNKKADQIEVTREVSETKKAILKKDHIEITVPYTTPLTGKVSFDIIVKDVASKTSYRKLIQR